MVLQLNAPHEPVDGYKEFYGPNNEKMPLLVAEGRHPLSAAGLMSRYLEVLELHRNAPKELKPAYTSLVRAWEDNNFSFGDGAARHRDGRMKVAPDAPFLRLLTPETRLVKGAVDLSDEGYAALAGEEFSEANVDLYCGKPLSESDAMQNPVWLALARGDKVLLGEFVKSRFARATKRFNYIGYMMGILPFPSPKEGAAGRLWAVNRLDDYANGSRAYCHYLDDHFGQLVGEAPEAQRAARRTLEQTI